MWSTSCEMPSWKNHKLESKLPKKYQQPQIWCRWYHSNGRKWRGTRVSWLFRMKEESEKAGLKLNIHKTTIMVSSSIISWQIDGKSGSSDRFYFLGFQNLCRMWLQPWNSKTLAPWKKSYDQPRQHIKKQRLTLPTKVCLVKAMFFFQ